MARTLRKRTLSSPSMESSSPSMVPSRLSLFNFCRRAFFSVLLLFSVATLCYSTSRKIIISRSSSSSVYKIEIINEFPHDPKAFTQGLLYGGNDILFESTGLYGRSSVRQVFLKTGKCQGTMSSSSLLSTIHEMDGSYFGEGLTLLADRLYQVTWLKNIGFIYDPHDLKKESRMFVHQMSDGWGLATDGKVLFGSDGTSTLYQLDPQSLKVLRKVTVTYKGHEIFYLNELEHINGEVWANVWQTDCIARISPRDGAVVGWILLPELRHGLISSGNVNIDVLNGIAWDPEKERLFVTGKLWPKLYEIKVLPEEGSNRGVEQFCMPVRE